MLMHPTIQTHFQMKTPFGPHRSSNIQFRRALDLAQHPHSSKPMKRTLIIGASGGIGQAIANHAQGEVTSLSRSQDGLDITDEASIETAFVNLTGTFDLIFVATGALVINGHQPEKSIRSVTADGLADQYRTNAIGPMLLLKHALPFLPTDRPNTFAALSARVGSIGDNNIGGWHSYRAAKSGLNQLLHGASVELKRTHKHTTLLALHPGTVATSFTEGYAAQKLAPDEAAQNLLDVINTCTIADTGKFFDYAGKEIPW
jgi:NAD(P)-dependent dehydrogenase (short-subunit alcohol dehydrogenase family)